MKKIAYYIGLCILMFLAVPYITTALLAQREAKSKDKELTLTIPKEAAETIKQSVPLDEFEKYIVEVVAAEMPALYSQEALKAQAVASRTYAINMMERTGDSDYKKAGQAYIDESEMRARWQDNYDYYYNKIAGVVQETAGEIMVYDGEPIVAVFHAYSAGRTENSADVWSEELPYLKSVDSSFDQYIEDFEQEVQLSGNEFIISLRNEFPDLVFDKGDVIDQIKINEYTEGGYVKSVTIGNKIMDGTSLRRILGLKSANFSVRREMDKIVFNVRGYGHGAGMSQAGANYLAKDGYDYRQILAHYYSGVDFASVDSTEM